MSLEKDAFLRQVGGILAALGKNDGTEFENGPGFEDVQELIRTWGVPRMDDPCVLSAHRLEELFPRLTGISGEWYITDLRVGPDGRLWIAGVWIYGTPTRTHDGMRYGESTLRAFVHSDRDDWFDWYGGGVLLRTEGDHRLHRCIAEPKIIGFYDAETPFVRFDRRSSSVRPGDKLPDLHKAMVTHYAPNQLAIGSQIMNLDGYCRHAFAAGKMLVWIHETTDGQFMVNIRTANGDMHTHACHSGFGLKVPRCLFLTHDGVRYMVVRHKPGQGPILEMRCVRTGHNITRPYFPGLGQIIDIFNSVDGRKVVVRAPREHTKDLWDLYGRDFLEMGRTDGGSSGAFIPRVPSRAKFRIGLIGPQGCRLEGPALDLLGNPYEEDGEVRYVGITRSEQRLFHGLRATYREPGRFILWKMRVVPASTSA